MNKYFLITKNTWAEVLTYRLNFVMWRLRVVLQLLTMYFLWFAILPQGISLHTYNQSQILTYILGTSLMSSIVIASRSYSVGEEINRGDLSNYLIKPINYFWYWFAKDLGDKAMNLAFSISEIVLLFFILRPPLFIQSDPAYLFLALVSALISMIMYFFLNLLLGFTGFWSPETWGPRFIFMIVLTFAAGGLFPLDILPPNIYSIIEKLPFTYLLYFPLKTYLGHFTIDQIITGLMISLIWAIIFYFAAKITWRKGLKIYTAQGR